MTVPFEGALVIHLFTELTDTELLFIQQFKTGIPAFRQTGLSQFKTQLMHFISRYQNGTAVIRELVRHIHLCQLADNIATVFGTQVTEQNAVIRAAHPEEQRNNNGDCSRAGDHQRNLRISLNTVNNQGESLLVSPVSCGAALINIPCLADLTGENSFGETT